MLLIVMSYESDWNPYMTYDGKIRRIRQRKVTKYTILDVFFFIHAVMCVKINPGTLDFITDSEYYGRFTT